MSRQLAAIMFTDIVGYTTLMGESEQKAFELLKKNRRVQQPLIKQFSGRWLKEIGDGVLASFTTVSDAVYCAGAIQKACTEHPDLKLRIGIHLGEVVFEREDVFGDGVNIASRLEPLAPIGGILVSEAVFMNIQNKDGIHSEFAGEQSLKNVKVPIRTYRLEVDQVVVPSITPESLQQTAIKKASLVKRAKTWVVAGLLVIMLVMLGLWYFQRDDSQGSPLNEVSANKKRSIAVLPFADMSPQKDQEYFSDGITEEIINVLVQIPDLKVASRTSSFQFRGEAKDIKSIGSALGVSTILEGSIRKADNRVRITAQLINVEDGFHIWSQTYERELDDIFAIQDELSNAIVSELNLKIDGSNQRLAQQKTTSMEAYNLYLRGRYFWNLRNEEGLNRAHELFQKAIDEDPLYALAYSGLADSYSQLSGWGFIAPPMALPKAKAAAEKALTLDKNLAQAHTSLGFIQMFYEWDWQAAETSFNRAIELNPNYAVAHQWHGELHHLLGDTTKARQEAEKALELDPLSLIINLNYARYFQRIENYPKAIKLARNVLDMNDKFLPAHYILWESYYATGEWDLVFEHVVKSSSIYLENPLVLQQGDEDSGLSRAANILIGKIESQKEDVYVGDVDMAHYHMLANNKSKALDFLEKAYLGKDTSLIFVAFSPTLKPLFSEPRFKDLLKKLNLQQPSV